MLDPTIGNFNAPRWVAWTTMACLTLSAMALPLVAQQIQSPVSTADAGEIPAIGDLLGKSLFERFQDVTVNPRRSVAGATEPDTNLHGYVTDATGSVAGAVILIRESSPTRDAGDMMAVRRIVARATSDNLGYYRIQGLRSPQPNDRWEVLAADRQNRFSFNLTPRPRARRGLAVDANLGQTDIVMPSSAVISGRIVTTSGDPLENVRIIVEASARIGIGHSDIFASSDPPDNLSMEDPFAPRYQVQLETAALRPVILSDADGRFSWKGPQGEMLDLAIECQGFYPRRLRVASAKGWKVEGKFYDPNRPVQMSPVKVELRKLVEIAVTVTGANGNPFDEDYSLRFVGPNRVARSLKLRNDLTWKTTAEFLRDAAGEDGQLKVGVAFRPESGWIDIEELVEVQELIAKRKLRFNTERGVHLSGKVLSSTDRSGIRGVKVCWHSDAKAISHQLHTGTTNERGEWEAVVPRQSGFVTVVGEAVGYDLASIERFNRDGGLQGRFTKAYSFDGRDRAAIEDFLIAPTANRSVRVVDTRGRAVAKVEVSAKRIETIEENGVVYRLPQELAAAVVTDQRGQCELTLSRSHWQEGTVYAQLVEFDDLGNILIRQFGRGTITPTSASPLEIVLKDPWRVTGRVVIDGRPAGGYEVALTKRMHRTKLFGQISDNASVDDDGTFEFIAPADYEYSVAVVQRTAGQPNRYYYLQEPATEVAPNQYRAVDIDISSRELKTIQEHQEEMTQKGLLGSDKP